MLFDENNLKFLIPSEAAQHLKSLPWQQPLEDWNSGKIRFITIKSGLSRHVVRFVQRRNRRFAIKETSVVSAGAEYENYLRLKELEIHTLHPVGIIIRDDGIQMVRTQVGEQIERKSTGYLVTELMEKVVPDSFLFRREFSTENRNRIWDSVIRLFVRMHSRGVYWGDASMANMLIRFENELVPELGHRTKLTAVLADAETVEIHRSISDSLRYADVEFFSESLQWTDADLRASGTTRDPMMTQDDQQYIMQGYRGLFAAELEMQSFELVTEIDVDKLLGNFDVKGYGSLLLQHVNEHKWYVSERQGREVSLVDAAKDWYTMVFKPVCKIFNDYGVLDYFPDKTASMLYVEIMEHKYFMSQKEKKDVELLTALEDYAVRFATHEPLRAKLGSIVGAISSLFRWHHGPSQNISLS